ncbi:MAG: hypothetical protein E6I04_01685 [Chloroflexi bacterium]|nr:MAG: hypothetical protein E6I36_09015 [Chloroflexota bacterium]TMF99894.1 MAG: hypothetical protein E6I04_01685 [Chloroflexota bacterium]
MRVKESDSTNGALLNATRRRIDAPLRQRHIERTNAFDRRVEVVDGLSSVPNLYIVDGSSLPTSGGVNPTATIQALALRCADQIWKQRREL